MIDRFHTTRRINMLSWRSRCGWFSTTDATGLGFPTNPIAPSAAFLGGSQKFKSSECGIRCFFFVAKKCMNLQFYVPRPEAILQVSPNIAFHHLADNNRFQSSIWNSKWAGGDMDLPAKIANEPKTTWFYACNLPCSTSAPEIVWRCLNHLNRWIIGPPCPPPPSSSSHSEDNQIFNSSDITESWL